MESQVDNQLENSVNFPYWGSKKQGKFKKSSPAPQFENINSLALRLLYVQLSHPYMTTRKNHSLYIFVIETLLLRTGDVPHCGLDAGNIYLNRTDKIFVLIT